jgi:hypothetical protein
VTAITERRGAGLRGSGVGVFSLILSDLERGGCLRESAPVIHRIPAHQGLVASSGGSDNRLKNVAGMVGNHEAACLGYEMCSRARESFGEDSARLR